MDEKRFDALVRARAEGASRRSVLKGLFGGIVGGVTLAKGTGRAFAEDETQAGEETGTTAAPDTGTTAAPDTGAAAADTGTTAGPDTGTTAGPDLSAEAEAEAASKCTTGEIWCGWKDGCVYGACCPDKSCGRCGECVEGGNGTYCVEPDCCPGDKRDCAWCKDGWWDYKCDEGERCCPDYKDGQKDVCVDMCCDDGECRHQFGPCYQCHLGTCFDICQDKGLFCKYVEVNSESEAEAAGGHWSPCAECLDDYHCYDKFGGCGYCDTDGMCQSNCDKGQICCLDAEAVQGSEPPYGCAWECCGDSDCYESHGACGYCDHDRGGVCRSGCDKGEVCCDNYVTEYGTAYCSDHSDGCCGGPGAWCDETNAGGEKLDGSCCYGLICSYDDKKKHGTCVQCENHYDCPDGNDGYGVCCDGWCQASCCKDKDCDYGDVCVEGYCQECGGNDDCRKGEICCSGSCERADCCSHDDCGDCELCMNGWCLQNPEYQAFGDSCWAPPIAFAGEDYTPQFNCCDGLLCCEKQKHGLTGVCLQCCDDHDCGKGCSCDYGVCSCACGSDKECEKGTCCCKDGSCSADCCGKPEKPGKKPGDGVSSVDTLPSTGSGSSQPGGNWIAAAALGAAAAYVAGKVIASDSTEEEGQIAEG